MSEQLLSYRIGVLLTLAAVSPGAADWLIRQRDPLRLAGIDPDEHLDYQSHRPQIELVDGVARTYLVQYVPVRDPSGAGYLGVSCVVMDISARRQAEEALREADRRKDEFLAMLSHELRNPLAPIRNAVQLLRHLGPQDTKAEEVRDLIERQVDHLVRLVDDLLDVSRIATGKINLQKETVDMAMVVAHAVETSRPQIDGRRHALLVSLPAEPVRVDGDFTRLVQVVSNLLDNAARYTDQGGRIELTLVRSGGAMGGEAALLVRDNGRGIDPATLDDLFELFFQAAPLDTRRHVAIRAFELGVPRWACSALHQRAGFRIGRKDQVGGALHQQQPRGDLMNPGPGVKAAGGFGQHHHGDSRQHQAPQHRPQPIARQRVEIAHQHQQPHHNCDRHHDTPLVHLRGHPRRVGL